MLVLGGQTVVLDDAHHHDDAAAPASGHYHERRCAVAARRDAGALDCRWLAHAFFVRALIAASLVGIVCAVVGTYVVLKGLAFIGDAVSTPRFRASSRPTSQEPDLPRRRRSRPSRRPSPSAG